MGYLNKATITVDAILTNRGRELLAKGGSDSFAITKFAIADDEVDYGLYNVAHPEGSEYYGAIIENMPVLEATPDEQQIMRYKLVTLGSSEFANTFVNINGEIRVPRILNFIDLNLNSTNQDDVLTPRTDPTFSESYTLIVADATLVNVYRNTIEAANLLNPTNRINSNGSITIKLQPSDSVVFAKITNKSGETTATIFGDSTGATATITINVATT